MHKCGALAVSFHSLLRSKYNTMSFEISVLTFLLLHLCNSAVVASEGEAESSKCSGSCQEDIPIEKLRSDRLQYIKLQILQKLGLESPPKVNKSLLPEILNSHLLMEAESEEAETLGDTFYGNTEEVVIFPDEFSINVSSSRIRNYFRFLLSEELSSRSIASALLWVHLRRGNLTAFKLAEISQEQNKSEQLIDEGNLDSNFSTEWIKFDLTIALRSWIETESFVRNFELTCWNGCEIFSDDESSFLLINTSVKILTPSKRKRSIVCNSNTTVCCKETLRVSFSDIGWNHWIIKPDAYYANFCRGNCLAEISSFRHFHTHVIQSVLHNEPISSQNLAINLCCTPARMRSLTIIYMTEKRIIYKKTLPNMTVESCDCA